jgi:MFS transporter, FSR family, fosmidomycin resistance protein
VLAGDGRRRRLAVLGGGILFVLTLLGVAAAHSFGVLLVAFIAFYPASGAFVSLTQAQIMDAWPDRQARLMARWDLAGSAGALAGPLLLTVVLAAGGGWRAGFLALAAIAGLTWLGAFLRPVPGPPAADLPVAHLPAEEEEGASPSWRERARETVAALRSWRTLRWLLLTEVANLLVDVFTGFLALYLVDVAHLAPAVAALAIAIRLGAALAGFLVFPGLVPKLAALAGLSAATAMWYPILQARLYGSLPGRSSVAVTLSSAAGLAGGLGPLAVGLAAQGLGLSWALAGLVFVPVAVLLIPGRGGPEA